MQILVQRVARSAATKVGWLVDEHGVHGLDVVADEACHTVENVRKFAVAGVAIEVINEGTEQSLNES